MIGFHKVPEVRWPKTSVLFLYRKSKAKTFGSPS